VNRALNGQFKGNVAAFEERIREFLKNEAKRRQLREEFFETGFTHNLNNFLETVRCTNDVGLGYSDRSVPDLHGDLK
jgi:DNA transposition AAA+ family ATPase